MKKISKPLKKVLFFVIFLFILLILGFTNALVIFMHILNKYYIFLSITLTIVGLSALGYGLFRLFTFNIKKEKKFVILFSKKTAVYTIISLFFILIFLNQILGINLYATKQNNNKNKCLVLPNNENNSLCLESYENNVLKYWFPFIKKIMVTSSNIKLPVKYLIDKKRIKDFESDLNPGDIILLRRDYYVSNIGIKGFWKHNVLYTGNLKELDKYFKNETQELFNTTFSKYLKEKYPQVYYKKTISTQSQNYKTIEAIEEGVVIKSIYTSLNADSISVLRPKLSKKEKLIAILFTFDNYKKGYDFYFDFNENSSFMCSELVFKAYSKKYNYIANELNQTIMGLNLTIGKRIGKTMLQPTELIIDYYNNYKKPTQQFDFVLYYKANRELGISEKKTEKELLETINYN